MKDTTQGVILLIGALILSIVALIIYLDSDHCVIHDGKEEVCFNTSKEAKEYIKEKVKNASHNTSLVLPEDFSLPRS